MKRITTTFAIGALALTLACDANPDSAPPGGAGADSQGGDADGQAAATWPEEDYRQQRPEPRPVTDVKFPSVHQFELANGMAVYLVQQDNLPTAYMTMEFEGGSNRDPKNKSGLASVCMDLLSEGTKSLDKIAFGEKQADIAASVWSSGGDESSSITARSLKAQMGPTLDLVAEMIEEPGMRQEDFDRIIERRVAGLAQQKATPDSIARRLFASLIWGKKHPYGHVVTEKSLQAIKLADCKKYVKRLRPDGAKLWVVGMVDEKELREELEPRLAFWKGKAPASSKVAAAKKPNGKIHFIQVDGAVQSMIMVGHPGPKRDAADYESTYLMGQILGGSFSSRINMNLREDKGFSYGGRGGFRYRKGGSHFAASSSVETTTTALALREVAKEIVGMRAGEPTDVEVKREQEGALLAMPARFSTPTKTLFTLKGIDWYGLPLDYYEGHQKKLRAVDAKSIQKAAGDHLSAGDFVVLVVGDGKAKAKDSDKTVLEEVELLAKEKVFGGGGIVFLDADGKTVKRPE
jgi:predicted Zn-dependent peptidase